MVFQAYSLACPIENGRCFPKDPYPPVTSQISKHTITSAADILCPLRVAGLGNKSRTDRRGKVPCFLVQMIPPHYGSQNVLLLLRAWVLSRELACREEINV